ncbi:MAG: hypothetical protein AB7G11_04370 [Phycisphaerales bacterium]
MDSSQLKKGGAIFLVMGLLAFAARLYTPEAGYLLYLGIGAAVIGLGMLAFGFMKK